MAPTSKGQNHPPGQQRISSFFSKSPSTKRKGSSSPIDLTADSDDSRPPSSKKLKTGERVTSSFFIRGESASSQSSVAGPSCSNAFRLHSSDRLGDANNASKWRYIPSSGDVTCGPVAASRKEKPINPDQTASYESTTLSFREKLRRRELDRKRRVELPNTKHDEESRVIEDEISLPWEKGAKRKKSDKLPAVVGPAGLPCTPLEEEVRVFSILVQKFNAESFYSTQVLNFKRLYPGTVLLIQVGYKFWSVGSPL